MTDIVERLKKKDCKTLLDAYDAMEEAADEIERLRQRELVLRAALIQISQQDYGALRPNKCVHDRYYYEQCIDCASDVAMRGLVEAYDSGETE